MEDRVYKSSSNNRVWFLKSETRSRGCSTNLKDYYLAASTIRVPRTEDFEMHGQKVYASRDFGTGRKKLNSFVKVRSECDERKEIWVARVLGMCRWFVENKPQNRTGEKLVFFQYTECYRLCVTWMRHWGVYPCSG